MSALAIEGERRDQRRRLRQGELMREWQARNRQRLNSRPPIVQGCLTLMAHHEAARLARCGAAGPLRLTAEAIALEMRRLVTQLRRQRHGALALADTATWHSQVGAIAAELGWQWTAAKPVPQDNPARKLRGLEAAHAIGIALVLFAAPPAMAPAQASGPPPDPSPDTATIADLMEA
jgi:hypothetical protein